MINASEFRNVYANEREGGKEQNRAPLDAAIEVVLEKPDYNTRVQALQYVMLHEFGHVAATRNTLIAWDALEEIRQPQERWAFRELSWTRSNTIYISKFEKEFPQRFTLDLRHNSVFQLETEKLNAIELYNSLQKTSIVSLYGVVNPFEDFAEAFAQYVHVILQKRQYETRIWRNRRIEATFPPCMTQPRCAEKRRLLDNLLRSAAAEPKRAQR